MKHSTFVRVIKGRPDGLSALYRLSEPVRCEDGFETSFVWVSAVPHVAHIDGPETYIFPADETGKVLSWAELPGSYKGGMSHSRALRQAGFPCLGIPSEVE